MACAIEMFTAAFLNASCLVLSLAGCGSGLPFGFDQTVNQEAQISVSFKLLIVSWLYIHCQCHRTTIIARRRTTEIGCIFLMRANLGLIFGMC